MQWLTIEITGEQRRAHHWYLCRGLQGWLHGPEQACPEVNAFLIERCYTAVFMREPTGCAIDAVVVSYRLDEEKVTRHFGARLLEATTKKDPLYLFFIIPAYLYKDHISFVLLLSRFPVRFLSYRVLWVFDQSRHFCQAWTTMGEFSCLPQCTCTVR